MEALLPLGLLKAALVPKEGLLVPNGADEPLIFGEPAEENDMPGDAEKVEKSEMTLREDDPDPSKRSGEWWEVRRGGEGADVGWDASKMSFAIIPVAVDRG
jgi:hypothetical protein